MPMTFRKGDIVTIECEVLDDEVTPGSFRVAHCGHKFYTGQRYVKEHKVPKPVVGDLVSAPDFVAYYRLHALYDGKAMLVEGKMKPGQDPIRGCPNVIIDPFLVEYDTLSIYREGEL